MQAKWALSVAIIGASVACSAPQQEQVVGKPSAGAVAGAQQMSPSFAWPETLDLRVRHRVSKHNRLARREADVLSVSYTLRLRPEGESMRLSPHDLQVPSSALGKKAADGLLTELQGLGEVMAPIVINAEGELERIEEVERIVKTTRGRLYRRFGDGRKYRDEVEARVNSERVSERTQRRWRELGEGWLGTTLSLGVPRRFAERQMVSVDGVGQTLVAHERAMLYVGSARCDKDYPTANCVLLTSRMTPDSRALRQGINQLMGRHIQRLAARENSGDADLYSYALRRSEVLQETELITEPTTMLPHRLMVRTLTYLTVTLTTPLGERELKVNREDIETMELQVIEEAE